MKSVTTFKKETNVYSNCKIKINEQDVLQIFEKISTLLFHSKYLLFLNKKH